MTEPKLPLWRLITGLAIFAALIGILLALAPTYIENYQLSRYIRTLAAAPDDTLKTEVVTRARQLALPVQPDDVHITHTAGKLQIQMRYKVKVDLALYPVDLHMSAP